MTYLMGLHRLTSLSLAQCAGLTDRTLQELSSSSRLRCLDLSGCRQLTEAGLVEFAGRIDTCTGPPLRRIQLDLCPNLGRAAAEALASKPRLHRCSLSSCRPLPEAATAWADSRGHAEACHALGLPAPLDSGHTEIEDSESEQVDFEQYPSSMRTMEIAQCAVCLDDIGPDEA